MYYFSTRIPITLFKRKKKKNVLVGLREIRGDPLENVKDLHNSCVLQPISNLFGGFFSIWPRGLDELSHPM